MAPRLRSSGDPEPFGDMFRQRLGPAGESPLAEEVAFAKEVAKEVDWLVTEACVIGENVERLAAKRRRLMASGDAESEARLAANTKAPLFLAAYAEMYATAAQYAVGVLATPAKLSADGVAVGK
jgi:hypothetical protein